jgi:hypothetical protein
MARIEAEQIREPERIFIAASLREARRVEQVLTAVGVDYVVQVEPFGRSVLFGTVRQGASFYVTSAQAAYCRSRLSADGLDRGVVEDQEIEGNEE